MGRSKIAKRRRRRNPSVKSATDLATDIGAGVVGYASVRLLSRIAFAQSLKRWPGAAKHLHVAASAASAAGIYFGSKHWSKIEDYHEAATIGAGIALFQTALQTYLPQLGWIVADVNADQYAATGKKQDQAMLPNADLTGMFEDPMFEESPVQAELPPAQGDFDLDAMLNEHPDVEAVEIGRTDAVPEMQDDGAVDNLDDLIHSNGMMH